MHDCITRSPRAGVPVSWRLDGLDGSAEYPVSGRFQANTTQAQLGAAVAGLGIALLPIFVTAAQVHNGQLQEVLPAYGLEAVGVYFVYLSRRQIPRAVSIFTEFARATMLEREIIVPTLSPQPRTNPNQSRRPKARRVRNG
jgi:LysR family transcriptional regulator AphB